MDKFNDVYKKLLMINNDLTDKIVDFKRIYEAKNDVLIDSCDEAIEATLDNYSSVMAFLQSEFHDDFQELDKLPSERIFRNVRITSDGQKYVVDFKLPEGLNDEVERIAIMILEGNFAPFMSKLQQTNALKIVALSFNDSELGPTLEEYINQFPSFEQEYQLTKLIEESRQLESYVKSQLDADIKENFEKLDEAKAEAKSTIDNAMKINYKYWNEE